MQKRWNISILVIFVLLASSLLGVLSMTFVQQMMRQSAVVNSYYKAYYLSKGWIELGLVTIKHRDVGFEYVVNTWDAIVIDNFSTGSNYSFSMNISGTAPLLSKKFRQGSGCESPYVLTGGESFVVPLFKDNSSWPIAKMLGTWRDYKNLADIFKNSDQKMDFVLSGFAWDVTFGILILSGDELSPNGIFFQTWTLAQWWLSSFRDAFQRYLATIDPTLYPTESQLKDNYDQSWLIDHWFKMYLLISNTSPSETSFCIAVKTLSDEPLWYVDVLPTDTFFIQSQASYGNQKVALDASYAQPIPGFLFSTYSQ